jgi:hypothetical protein
VRRLRIPGKTVERRQNGDAARGAGEDLGEKSQNFGNFFRAAVVFGDEVGGAAEFVGDVGGDEGFRYILQAGKAYEIAAGAHFPHYALHCRVAQERFQSFSHRRQYHFFPESIPIGQRVLLLLVLLACASIFLRFAANLVDDVAGRIAWQVVDQHDFSASAFDFFASDDLIARPVAAFH